ncbi:hypothetical protein [Rhodoplanes sp. Z2-YC6860]|uniref:hypothetical protein n=1 Tax=Rhodoplanes sp. Z2-YC6860 TaxID=674703 RepID=UPI00082996DA|nr:hypothetical protein [Rhodoplanes sp. Z2-YC6860]
MPDTAQFTSGYAAQNDLPFPVLSDIDLGYSLALGLIFWVGAEVQQLYEDAGVELETYIDNGGYFLPMAASPATNAPTTSESQDMHRPKYMPLQLTAKSLSCGLAGTVTTGAITS